MFTVLKVGEETYRVGENVRVITKGQTFNDRIVGFNHSNDKTVIFLQGLGTVDPNKVTFVNERQVIMDKLKEEKKEFYKQQDNVLNAGAEIIEYIEKKLGFKSTYTQFLTTDKDLTIETRIDDIMLKIYLTLSAYEISQDDKEIENILKSLYFVKYTE